ncbi:MAG: DEAD/DEAH box helicase [Phycisphaerales bacterium]|nr:DEAD/DEAH box helicase [Phycisphaerales bacterium]
MIGEVMASQPRVTAGEIYYRVRFSARKERVREADLVLHQGSDEIWEILASHNYGGPAALRRQVTSLRIRSQLTDTLYSLGASRTKMFPYQFVPLLKYLDSPYRRILVGDEVGLGKTIEAGYILLEELARSSRPPRILIVCPAALRLKWQAELLDRFGLEFEILRGRACLSNIVLGERELRTGRPLRGVVSMQTLQQESVREGLESQESPLDLLIVDEAHHFRNPNAYRSHALESLTLQAEAAVFLTATPIQTSDRNLFQLLRLLVPEEFPSESAFDRRMSANQPLVEVERLLAKEGDRSLRDAADLLEKISEGPHVDLYGSKDDLHALATELRSADANDKGMRIDLQSRIQEYNLLSSVFTRTKRKHVHIGNAVRRAHAVRLPLSEYEQDVYEELTEGVYRYYHALHGARAAAFILSGYQQRIASSLVAAVERFRQIGELDDDHEDHQDHIPESDDSSSSPMDSPEFAAIVEGIDLTQLEQVDTKYGLLLKALKDQKSAVESGQRRSTKAIIFATYRRTLDYLEKRLSADGFVFVRIDGTVVSRPDDPDRDERGRRIDQFRHDSAVDILLSSEVGSEGLDFQFCDTVINWDLPWNPMRVEQRIGRVDRIGQLSDTLFIVNLACDGTIETRILDLLYERIGVFERSIGELEPILGDLIRSLERRLLKPGLSSEQRDRIIFEEQMAVERQHLQNQELEGRCSELIGHDQFFYDKLAGIRNKGKYVSGDELRLFVEHELSIQLEGCVLKPGNEPDLWQIPDDPRIVPFVERHLSKEDPAVRQFVMRYRQGRGKKQYAFEGGLAERYPDVEPFHGQHPLVAALAKNAAVDDEVCVVAHFSVVSDAVEPGEWLLGWYMTEETGFMARKELAACAMRVDVEDLVVATRDQAEILLADGIRRGSPVGVFSPPSSVDSEAVYELLEDQAASAVEQRRRDRSARFKSMKARRRDVIDATYRHRIERQREIAKRLLEQQKRPAQAALGKVDKLEREMEDKLEEVDRIREGAVTFRMVGCGFVKVLPPQD